MPTEESLRATGLSFRLPLPISKNRKVEASVRRVFHIDLKGKAYHKYKAIVRNSKDWKKYKRAVWEVLVGEMHLHLLPTGTLQPGPDERLAFDCTWYLKRKHSDCVNFHDLLADAIKDAIDVDDDVFLIRDVWSSVDAKDPHVDVVMRKVGAPDS